VLQAMDTGGKDGTIKHVFSGVNPQGCRVSSFKTPSAEESNHDFLWRYHKSAPARGRIGIFNRSHYEDVLVVRVKGLVPEAVWRERYRQINDFERNLSNEKAPPVTPRQSGQALEVLLGRHQRTRLLERLPGRFRGRSDELLHRTRPLVRSAGQQQMVPKPRHRPYHCRYPRADRPAVPSGRGGLGEGGDPGLNRPLHCRPRSSSIGRNLYLRRWRSMISSR
jgi:hypothetical protein